MEEGGGEEEEEDDEEEAAIWCRRRGLVFLSEDRGRRRRGGRRVSVLEAGTRCKRAMDGHCCLCGPHACGGIAGGPRDAVCCAVCVQARGGDVAIGVEC